MLTATFCRRCWSDLTDVPSSSDSRRSDRWQQHCSSQSTAAVDLLHSLELSAVSIPQLRKFSAPIENILFLKCFNEGITTIRSTNRLSYLLTYHNHQQTTHWWLLVSCSNRSSCFITENNHRSSWTKKVQSIEPLPSAITLLPVWAIFNVHLASLCPSAHKASVPVTQIEWNDPWNSPLITRHVPLLTVSCLPARFAAAALQAAPSRWPRDSRVSVAAGSGQYMHIVLWISELRSKPTDTRIHQTLQNYTQQFNCRMSFNIYSRTTRVLNSVL